MSFKLAVWYEPKPITKEHAENVFQALRRGEPDAAAAHPGVAAFAERLPEARQVSPEYALVTVERERSDEVSGVAFEAARECELVCYDPQRRLVHNREPLGAYPGMQMHTGDGMILIDPDLQLVHDALATMGPQNPFTALVVFGEHFIQTSPEPGGYELEYKDSVRNAMFRTHVADLETVQDAFAEYAVDNRAFLERHDWERV
ncbi:hypothetical protein Ppa06_15150 [Planomonospora parontospora subsp. parontospora]|uniref:Uncharacterized protein n=2 Tax=Planomonospora parontospora TaxID=58119 RepID=A0AA37BE03_9ACTN|nr:hypothetical protein [Planomonospora parontospora]GGK56940.1 hypothetical protein GCM10010126_15700 [Planomonospora parontospora]GII07717.1 hypothetical protein Ppa06_15150 [Planomonospora parontospora subsp. parontospora]